jgi:PHD/YefM family antitoxin component YafN of YafNO toxin-antitoxin module
MNILPISELKNTSEISELCETEREPIYITKNGRGHLVIMTMNVYEEKMAKLELMEKLMAAEADIAAGRVVSFDEAFAQFDIDYDK